jgi:hypothetical protein
MPMGLESAMVNRPSAVLLASLLLPLPGRAHNRLFFIAETCGD